MPVRSSLALFGRQVGRFAEQHVAAVRELGVDYGQGFYFGQPTERPLEVDPRLVRGQIAMRMG